MKKKLLIATTKALSFRSNRNFTPKPNHLSFEICCRVDPLKVQQCGWSHAASVSSEATNSQKRQKKVARHERRAMVEAFVNRYRAENAGKFPKISDTQKQVGGCFYIVRQIIQELEYKSKMNSSNSVDENLVGKQFDGSKLITTESVNVSSGNFEIAKDCHSQDDSQLVVLDDKETVNTGCEHLEENREPQTSYLERRLPEEVEIMSAPGNHCIAPESNIVEKCSKEPYPRTLGIQNDIKIEEDVSTYSDSFAPECQLLQVEREQFSSSLSEKCIKKTNCERKQQSDLKDLSKELLHSSIPLPNDVTSREAVSSSSDSFTQERHTLKVEIDQFSASFIEKSVKNYTEGRSHDSKLLDMENHSVVEEKNFEKEGYERKDQEVVHGSKHKIEQSQRSLELDESKMESSNNRETSVAVGSEKQTIWGNLKSFANGIINIWKKL